MKEVVSDGWIAARRCVEAMVEVQDVETRRSLWRAAVRYAQKDRTDAAGERNGSVRPHAQALGGSGGRLAHDLDL